MPRELMVVLVLVVGCPRGEHEATPGPRAVRCTPTIARATADLVELRGTVAPLPDRDAQIAPQVSGRLASVDVREGDAVKSGQVVAHIDSATLSDAVLQADAALDRAKAERKNAETTLARAQRVFERGISAQQEVDDATARAAAARAAEADAEAASHQSHRQLERAQVRAPIAGVAVRVFRKSGELVDGTPATPVVEVADPSRLELVADAPVQEVMRLKRGDAATVTFPAAPGLTLKASVVVVAPSVDRATGLGVVRLELELSTGRAPPLGTYGQAHIEAGGTRESTWAPADALRNVLGVEGEVVTCGPDGHAHVVRVEPGARAEGLVAVRGVDAGVPVVVEGLLGLSEGDAIEARK